MSKTIYCISGLGADEKIFANLALDGYELKYIPWLPPGKHETLPAYASRMAAAITEKDAVLVGVSFGGIVGVEIARQRPLKKLILISSIKSVSELPAWMKAAAKLRLNKIIPVSSFRLVEGISDARMGVSSKEEKKMVKAYRRAADPVYVKWAIGQVINWKNDWQPERLVHIHGQKDKIFPLKKIKSPVVIQDGTHLMIYNRAGEISSIILAALENGNFN